MAEVLMKQSGKKAVEGALHMKRYGEALMALRELEAAATDRISYSSGAEHRRAAKRIRYALTEARRVLRESGAANG